MRYSKIQYVCWLFSGAEITLLKECPTDFNRQASIGFTIFMTCLLAGLSGGFAAWRFTLDQQTQEGNWIASIIFGVVWGLLVFSIDRSMVVTLKKDPTKEKQPFFVPLVTRMILAGLLAFMISIPLETKIFEPEIEKQAMEDIQNAKLKYGTSVTTTSGIGSVEARKSDAAEQARIANQQLSLEDAKIPGVSGIFAEAVIQDEIARSKELDAQRQEQVAVKAREQSYVRPHTNPATGVQVEGYFSSTGPAGKRYRAAKIAQKNLRDAANIAHIRASQLRQEARKKADLFRVSADKARAQAAVTSALAETERQNKQAKNDSTEAAYEKQIKKRGFISEFVSMENAAHQQENGAMLFFLWFIRILFFVIEILPTIVKLATPVGEYDHQLYAHEQMFALALKTNYKILQDRELTRQQTELNITNQLEQIRQEKEVELGQKMLEQTATIQNSLAKQMLNDWHKVEKEKQRLSSIPPPPAIVNPNSMPSSHSNSLSTTFTSKTHQQPSSSTDITSSTIDSSLIVSQPAATQQHDITESRNQETVISPSLESLGKVMPEEKPVTNAALTAVSMWRLSEGSLHSFYTFENGSVTNNRVRRKIGSAPLEDGLWEYPRGDKNRLRISFGSNDQEYDIQRLTNTELHLRNIATNQAVVFTV